MQSCTIAAVVLNAKTSHTGRFAERRAHLRQFHESLVASVKRRSPLTRAVGGVSHQ